MRPAVAEGEGDWILIVEFPALGENPEPARPSEKDGAEQPQEVGRAVKAADVGANIPPTPHVYE